MTRLRAKGYISSRPLKGSRLAQQAQNVLVRAYCDANNLQMELSAVEYCWKDKYLVLNRLIAEAESYAAIVFYSLFQLPNDKAARCDMVTQLLKQQKSLHFALERTHITKVADLDRIEDCFLIQKFCDAISE